MAIINSYAAGTPTASDLILGVDTSNSKNTTKTFTAGDIASLASGSTAYDSYVALLTQASTSSPVATVLSNNLTATLTWARTNPGVYTLTANAVTFTANKTIVFLNAGSGVTLYSKNDLVTLTGQYSGASITKKASGAYFIVGDLA